MYCLIDKNISVEQIRAYGTEKFYAEKIYKHKIFETEEEAKSFKEDNDLSDLKVKKYYGKSKNSKKNSEEDTGEMKQYVFRFDENYLGKMTKFTVYAFAKNSREARDKIYYFIEDYLDMNENKKILTKETYELLIKEIEKQTKEPKEGEYKKHGGIIFDEIKENSKTYNSRIDRFPAWKKKSFNK